MKNISTIIHLIFLLLLYQLLDFAPNADILSSAKAQEVDPLSNLISSIDPSTRITADSLESFNQSYLDASNNLFKDSAMEPTPPGSKEKILGSDSTYPYLYSMPFDYYRSVERFKIYDPLYEREPQVYRQDLVRHDRNQQHYKNNLFLMRETEFDKMTSDRNYLLTKQGLVMANYILTGGLNPERFGDSRYLLLKSQNKLVLNTTLNLFQKVLGSQNVETRPGWVALDVHVHTYNSFDGTSNIETLLLTADEKGFGAIAITDHDYFDDAHLAQRIASKLKKDGRLPLDFVVIQGMEISSRDGHILGLFLKSYIPHGMSAEQTIMQIHSQGGLAIAPHPLQQDFGVGRKLVKTLPFDGMIVTGFGPEFQLSLDLSKEVKSRMAIFMDSDTHVENGLAWVGYTLVQTDDLSPEGIYNAVKSKQTEPVHRNLMQFQKRAISRTPIKFLTHNIGQLYNFKFRVEDEFARLLNANRISIRGLAPDLIDDIVYLNLINPAGDRFLAANILNSYFIGGLTAYYGSLYFDVQKSHKSFDAEIGIKLFW